MATATLSSAFVRRRVRLSPAIVLGLLRAWDVLVVLLAGLLAHATRFADGGLYGSIQFPYLVIGMVLAPQVFALAGVYGRGSLTPYPSRFGRLLVGWCTVMVALVAIGFATQTGQDLSRLWMAYWFAYGAAGIGLSHAVLRRRVAAWRREGHLACTVAIVGAGGTGRALAERLRRVGDGSVRLVGLFDDDPGAPAEVAGYPVLGGLEPLCRLVRNQGVEHVVVAVPAEGGERLSSWLKRLIELPVDVSLCPAVLPLPLRSGDCHVAGVPLLKVAERPLQGWGCVVKNVEDRVLALLLLVFFAPLMLLAAVAVRLDSPGPVLFRQKRYGFNNQIIEVLKFRTMRAEAAEDGLGAVAQARAGDGRITRVGRFLRRLSVDELPQLWNVLRGEMSLVGPRPHAVAHNEHYARVVDAYLGRHRVRPGITGWAQVNGLRGETDTLDKMRRRVEYDLAYIENWTLGFDLRILLRTVLVGFVHENAR
ncbi:MAG: undecaprenyl-phosphate glucose phosphotransferase [Geminicoccaceae bacterium]|nr:undecaprenyl-phosphate glucose phosphotransferase [Geminicoccaceae bacterium]